MASRERPYRIALSGAKLYVLQIQTDMITGKEIVDHDCSESIRIITSAPQLALEELHRIAADYNSSLIQEGESEPEDLWRIPRVLETGVKYHGPHCTFWIDEYVVDQSVREMEAALEVSDAGRA